MQPESNRGSSEKGKNMVNSDGSEEAYGPKARKKDGKQYGIIEVPQERK